MHRSIFPIPSLLLHQVSVAALFDDFTALKHVDAIGMLNGTEPMSDGYGCPSSCRRLKCLLYCGFGVGIEG